MEWTVFSGGLAESYRKCGGKGPASQAERV